MSKIIGEKIRTLRDERNLTQEYIANSLGMTRQRFSRLEKGTVDITYDILVKLAELFLVSVNDITEIVEHGANEKFRTGGESTSSFSEIHDMLNLFYANKRLYERMNPEVDDD